MEEEYTMATTFFQRVEALCAERGMTTTDLGPAAGIGNGTVSGWRRGAEPQISTVKKVAAYFNVSVAYLAGKTDDPIDYSTLDTTGFDAATYDNVLKKCKGNVEQANREYLEYEKAQAQNALSDRQDNLIDLDSFDTSDFNQPVWQKILKDHNYNERAAIKTYLEFESTVARDAMAAGSAVFQNNGANYGMIGNAHAPVKIVNGTEHTLTDHESELLRIFSELSVVEQSKVLIYASELRNNN
jgi:transcriptional regulator with XRE-family HTH domain